MNTILVIFVTVTGGLVVGQPTRAPYCVRQLNECVCELNNGKMIDLHHFDVGNVLKPA